MAETPWRSAVLPVQRMEPVIDAVVLTTLVTVCRSMLHVGFRYRDLRTYVTGFRAGVHQQGDKARVVMAKKVIPHLPPRWKRLTIRIA